MSAPLLPPPAPDSLLSWMCRHTGFPQCRLPARAELLLLFASAAAEEERPATETAVGGPPGRGSQVHLISTRQWMQRRSHAHTRSDNSAKV